MFFTYTAGLVILILGLRAGLAGLIAVGGGIVCVAWGGLLTEERLAGLWRIWRLRTDLPGLSRFFRRESVAVARARPLCRVFARHYLVYLRCPYRLDEDGRVRMASSRAERRGPFSVATLPPMFADLANILAEEGIHFPALSPLVLIVNREVMAEARERLRREVLGGGNADGLRGSDLWGRFVRFETARVAEWGGLTLYWREAMADVLAQEQSREWIAHDRERLGARTVSEWIDRGIQAGREAALHRLRADRLRIRLQNGVLAKADEIFRAQGAPDEGLRPSLTVRDLGMRAKADIARVTRELRDVFAASPETMDGIGPDGQEEVRLAEGYFVAHSEGRRVVFQVGAAVSGTVGATAIDRAFVHRAREGADQAVLLALGPVAPEIVQRADSIGVLVLPQESLDRLLAYHTDRMWQTVEWSLRAASLSKNVETSNLPVEIGFST